MNIRMRSPVRFRTFAVLAALSLAAFGCGRKQEATREAPPLPVRTAGVEQSELAPPLHLYGRLSSKKEMRLSFKVPGIIERILADEGRTAKKGDLLARLNLAEVESQVKQARSAYEKAERDLARIARLYEERAVALEYKQNVQTARDIALSQLRAAEFNLEFSVIKAPSSGKVLKRLAEEHELVAAGNPVFLFASLDGNWVVRTAVSDTDFVRIRAGDEARASFDAFPGRAFRGMITEKASLADPLTGTFEVEVQLEPLSFAPVSGLVAKVDVFPSDKKTYAVIPVQALVEARGRTATVFTLDETGRKAKALRVTVGFLFEDRAAVSGGLEGVSRVVTEGAAYLIDGAPVRPVETEPAAKEQSRGLE